MPKARIVKDAVPITHVDCTVNATHRSQRLPCFAGISPMSVQRITSVAGPEKLWDRGREATTKHHMLQNDTTSSTHPAAGTCRLQIIDVEGYTKSTSLRVSAVARGYSTSGNPWSSQYASKFSPPSTVAVSSVFSNSLSEGRCEVHETFVLPLIGPLSRQFIDFELHEVEREPGNSRSFNVVGKCNTRAQVPFMTCVHISSLSIGDLSHSTLYS